MKSITRLFLIIMTFSLSIQCKKDDPIPVVYIPDNNFLNALIDKRIDSNKDGEVSLPEVEIITYLDVSYQNITDLTGIEKFVNLEHLECQYNGLKSLDLSNISTLKSLFCENNQLTGLDVTHNTALSVLHCEYNLLTSLDVSNNDSLIYLNCFVNQLTSLDITNNSGLISLICGYNQFASLDVSNNISVIALNLMGMPSLNKVCVWEIPFPPDGVGIDTTDSPNVYFTVDCK